MTKNILVTGGVGFIGSHTVVELYEAGYNPIIVDNYSNSDKSVLDNIQKITRGNIDAYEGDYQDKSLLDKILSKHNISGVIHFAAYKAVGESVENPLKYYSNNVSGLITLLEKLDEYAIGNFVFSSSCTVYGQANKLPIDEKESLKPAESPYGTTKQMGEQIVSDYTTTSSTAKSLALRYFNPIGAHPSGMIGELPKGTPSNLVPFITQTAAGIRKELTVFGDDYPTKDGTCIRDYIHVVDLAKAHVKSIQHLEKKRPGHYDYINIGTGRGHTVLEVINTFNDATGETLSYKIGARRKGDITSAYADVQKAQKELGWKSELTLEEALRDAWNWQLRLKN